MPGGLGYLPHLPGRHRSSQDVLPQFGQSVPQIQRISHQRSRRSAAGVQAGAKFGGSELQHLRGAVPTQPASSLGTRQPRRSRVLAVGMVQIRPMRRQLQLLTFQPQDQTASPRQQRQCCRSIKGCRSIRARRSIRGCRGTVPTRLTIEHAFILETSCDSFRLAKM